jgi:hypothetical protein
VLHHVLLAAATVALGAAGLRVTSLAAPSGLERALAAAALGFAAAVCEALLLGLFGLGGSSWALAGAALATWLAARLLVPAPDVTVGSELASWWDGLPAWPRVLTGALAGAWLAWVVWLLRHPSLGFDTVLYHLSEAAVWTHGGSPGSIELILRGLPVTNYPITDEVFLTWAIAISRSLVPASLLVPAQVLLLGAAAWCGLRSLAVPRPVAGVAVAALCSLPAVIGWQSNGAATDPAALAWLVTAAALVAASRARPALVAPAVVAAGLAIGTKTTTGPLVVVLLCVAAWLHRERLRAMWRPLALAAVLALGAGGVWYLRNLFDHGSPLWPFVALPWGDSLPPAVKAANDSFLSRPGETLDAVGDLYRDRFLAGIVLLAGALVAPLLAWRRRAVLLASAAAVGSLLVWAQAPFTGVPDTRLRVIEGTFSTTRYLLPALAAAVLALALAGAGRSVGARIARAVLAAAAAIGLVQAFRLGFPAMPSALTPVAGAAVGAAVAFGEHVLGSRRPHVALGRLGRPVALACALALGALLAWPASGYVERFASTGAFASAVSRWLAGRGDSDRPVSSAPIVVGTATGDRLERPLSPIPEATGCVAMRRRARDGYVLLYVGPPADRKVLALARCLAPREPDYEDREFRAWAPGG